MAEMIMELALAGLREKGRADAQALAVLSVAGEADGTYLIAHEKEIPTWRQRDFSCEDTPIGKPYQWNGQIYKLWQQHDATNQPGWSPDLAVSLWDICHTKDPKQAKEYQAPQGTRGLWHATECCVLNGHVWKCLTDNQTYSPMDLPDGWENLGPVSEVQA